MTNQERNKTRWLNCTQENIEKAIDTPIDQLRQLLPGTSNPHDARVCYRGWTKGQIVAEYLEDRYGLVDGWGDPIDDETGEAIPRN